jgi:hypothetical protein
LSKGAIFRADCEPITILIGGAMGSKALNPSYVSLMIK